MLVQEQETVGKRCLGGPTLVTPTRTRAGNPATTHSPRLLWRGFPLGGNSFDGPNIAVEKAHDVAQFQIITNSCVPLYCSLTLSSSAIGSKVLATRLAGGTAPSIDVPNFSGLSNAGYWIMRHPPQLVSGFYLS